MVLLPACSGGLVFFQGVERMHATSSSDNSIARRASSAAGLLCLSIATGSPDARTFFITELKARLGFRQSHYIHRSSFLVAPMLSFYHYQTIFQTKKIV